MKRTKAAFVIGLLTVRFVFAQCPKYDLQPPHLNNVLVKSLTTQNSSSKIFTYTYSIVSGITSTGCINGIDIDISIPLNSLALSDSGLSDYPRYVDRSTFKFDTTVRVTSVGIPRLPSYKGLSSAWFASFSVDSTVGWFRAIPEYRLEPGGRIDGIVMTSHALPGIRRFIISPSYSPKPDVEVTPQNEDSLHQNATESLDEEEAFQQLEKSIKVRGVTVGPTPPPFPFVPATFLDTLVNYVIQSKQFRWVETQATANKYFGYFNAAKSNLQSNDIDGARIILHTVLSQTILDTTSNLTNEAFALIHYNTEYLIAKLPSSSN